MSDFDPNGVLAELGIDVSALSPEDMPDLSPTRLLDVVTAQMLDTTVWGDEEARLLVALLEDPDLPQVSRDGLLWALADRIHVSGASEHSDPHTLWHLGDAVFAVNYTAQMDPVVRRRLARALGGYAPDRAS